MLTVNEGRLDRMARIVVGAAMISVALWILPPGSGRTALLALSLLPLLTGLIGWCPLYAVLGVNTLMRPAGGAPPTDAR